MIYKGQNIQVQSGDVVLFHSGFLWYRPMTYLSAAIRLFTKCYYNHTGLIVSNWQVHFINEALAQGVTARPLQDHIHRSKTNILILRPKTPIAEEQFCVKANGEVGENYDYRNLLIYQLIYRIIHTWVGTKNDAAVKDGFVCSEYVAWAYNLPNWWKYSTAEIYKSDQFQIIYQEK